MDHSLLLPDPALADRMELRAMAQSVSDAQAQDMYGTAYQLQAQGHHERAGRILALLCMFRPAEPVYWRAAGICCQRLRDYPGAVRAFTHCIGLAPQDTEPGLRLVECLLMDGRPQAALDLLRPIIALARSHADLPALQRADGLLDLMELSTAEDS